MSCDEDPDVHWDDDVADSVDSGPNLFNNKIWSVPNDLFEVLEGTD